MFDKVNILGIVQDHFKTLLDYNSKKINWYDVFGFIVLPIIGAILLIWLGVNLEQVSTILITSLSIFAALLFNLLLLVFDLISKQKPKPDNSKKRDLDIVAYEVSKELFTNISYSILVSIVTIIILIAGSVSSNKSFLFAIEFMAFFLIGNFLFTLLMVLKRTHAILTFEFKHKKKEFEEKYKDIE